MTDTTATDAAAAQEGAGTEAPAATEATTVEQLPKWAQKLITDTRNEAAKHRTDKTSAVEAAKLEASEAHKAELEKVSAERGALESDLNSTRLELLKLQVALDAEIPGPQAREIAGLLKGESKEDFAKHAETLKKTFGITTKAPATDPTQGVGGEVKKPTAPGLGTLRSAYGAA